MFLQCSTWEHLSINICTLAEPLSEKNILISVCRFEVSYFIFCPFQGPLCVLARSMREYVMYVQNDSCCHQNMAREICIYLTNGRRGRPTVLDLKWHDNYFHKHAICIAYNQSLRFIVIFRVVSIVCYFTSYNSYRVICMFTLQNVQHKESNITPCHWRSENIMICSGFSGTRKTIVWLDSYEIL